VGIDQPRQKHNANDHAILQNARRATQLTKADLAEARKPKQRRTKHQKASSLSNIGGLMNSINPGGFSNSRRADKTIHVPLMLAADEWHALNPEGTTTHPRTNARALVLRDHV